MNFITKLWNDDRGQDLIEYALMAGFVAVAAGGIFSANIVPKLQSVFGKVEDVLEQAEGASS